MNGLHGHRPILWKIYYAHMLLLFWPKKNMLLLFTFVWVLCLEFFYHLELILSNIIIINFQVVELILREKKKNQSNYTIYLLKVINYSTINQSNCRLPLSWWFFYDQHKHFFFSPWIMLTAYHISWQAHTYACFIFN